VKSDLYKVIREVEESHARFRWLGGAGR